MKRIVLVSLALGCGQPAAPRAPAPASGPSAAVRADVEQAELAERSRRHDLARAHYEQAIRDARDPASQVFARREYAETLETWGEVAAAIAQLQAAVAAGPGDAAAWHDLGILRHHEGDTPGAVAALERAKQLAPHDPRPRIALAALRWCTDDRAGAAAEYRGLLELDLPDRVREKVRWALDALDKPARADDHPRCTGRGPASSPAS